MRAILSLSTLLILFFNPANAQVKTNFNNSERITVTGKFAKDFRGKTPYRIPARDIKTLLEKEALENASGESKLFRIAEAVSVDIDVVKEAEWTEENGSSYGRFFETKK